MKKKIITVLILFFFVTSCSTDYYVRFRKEEILPKTLRSVSQVNLKDFYSYKKEGKLNKRLIKEYSDFKLYQIRFPFDQKSLFPEKDFAEFLYYLPKGGKNLPAVVILPHLAGRSGLERFFSIGLVRQKFAVLTLGEPYFTVDRRDGRWWMKELEKVEDLERIKLLFRQLVIDTRKGIDFLEEQPEINKEKIGILGLSLGGCLSILVMGIDQRIKTGAFLLAGGDLVTLVKKSGYARPMRDQMNKNEISFTQMQEDWLEIEPLNLAPYIKGREIFMINATFDHILPSACTKKLWQVLEEPRIVWIPSGHYGAVLFLNYARREIIRFFEKKLAG